MFGIRGGIPTATAIGVAGVRRFTDLECHKLASALRREIVRLTAREPARRDFTFVAQIRDAAGGGTRNIAEGFSRFNPAEILQYISWAQASIDEAQDEIIDGQESGYFSRDEADNLLSLVHRTLGALRRWRTYLESPAARRFYEHHKARKKSEPANHTNPANLEPANLEPANPEPANPRIEPREPREP